MTFPIDEVADRRALIANLRIDLQHADPLVRLDAADMLVALGEADPATKAMLAEATDAVAKLAGISPEELAAVHAGLEAPMRNSAVVKAVEMSLSLLADRQPLARPLLRLLTMLDDAEVPPALLDVSLLAGSPLFTGLEGQRGLSAIVNALADSGLVELVAPGSAAGDGFSTGSAVLRVPPEVRSTSRQHVELAEDRVAYLSLAAALLDRSARNRDPEDPSTWPLWRLLAPHCSSLLQTIAGGGPASIEDSAIDKAASAAHKAGCYLHAGGRYEEAEAAFQAVLGVRRSRLGDDIGATLKTRQLLACVWRDMDLLEEAEEEFRAIYEKQEKNLLGRARLDPAGLLGQLARSGWDTDEGLTLLARGWDIDLARPILDMLDTNQELAITLAYRAQSASDEYETAAKRMYQKVYQARRRILGDYHPDTLASRHGLAIRLFFEGRLKEAEKELRAVDKAERQQRGDDHPDTLVTRRWIGSVLVAHSEKLEADRLTAGPAAGGTGEAVLAGPGEYEVAWLKTAKDIYDEVYRAGKRVLGDDHPWTVRFRYDLARVWVALGRQSVEIGTSPTPKPEPFPGPPEPVPVRDPRFGPPGRELTRVRGLNQPATRRNCSPKSQRTPTDTRPVRPNGELPRRPGVSPTNASDTATALSVQKGELP